MDAARDRPRAGRPARNAAAGPGCRRRRRARAPRHAGGMQRLDAGQGALLGQRPAALGHDAGRGQDQRRALGEAGGDGAEAGANSSSPASSPGLQRHPRRCGKGRAASGDGRAAPLPGRPAPPARSPARARGAGACRRRTAGRASGIAASVVWPAGRSCVAVEIAYRARAGLAHAVHGKESREHCDYMFVNTILRLQYGTNAGVAGAPCPRLPGIRPRRKPGCPFPSSAVAARRPGTSP